MQNPRRVASSSRVESLQAQKAELEQSIAGTRKRLAALHVSGDLAEQLRAVEETLESNAVQVGELRAERAIYFKFVEHAASRGGCLVCSCGFPKKTEAVQLEQKLRARLQLARESLGPAEKERYEIEQVAALLKPAVPIEAELRRLLAQLAVAEAEPAIKVPGAVALAKEADLAVGAVAKGPGRI